MAAVPRVERDVLAERDRADLGVFGRAFPPLWTHCRISIGTMDQMQRAVKIFDKVLSTAQAQAA